MKQSLIFTCSLITLLTLPALGQHIKKGHWISQLYINENTSIPFDIEVIDKETLVISNAEEKLPLSFLSKKGDTVIYELPDFESELHILWRRKKMDGFWLNKNKRKDYQMAFTGRYARKSERFENTQDTKAIAKLASRYEVVLSPNENGIGESAVAIFEQKDSRVTGTFLTETGDYRYLEGNIYGNKLYLSCFDGSHAFLFEADIVQDELHGYFYSGKHYKTNWTAKENASASLRDPYALTYVQNKGEKLSFSFPDIQGNTISFPNENYQDKVVIIQLMGSWCPNCMDETRFYLDLYKDYHHKGLEFIAVAYEIDKDPSRYPIKLQRLKERYNIPYPLVIGGEANKSKTSKDFPMLNKVISYPTSIIINKEGDIVKVHTGFYGPGTGEYYTDYTAEMRAYLERLLAE